MEQRQLIGTAFPDDTGASDPRLEAALVAFDTDPAAYAAALEALCHARVLVPVVAVLGEVEVDEAGLAHDKTSDMATVLLSGADGRWNASARPVPVTATVAAQSAVQEGAAALLVDVAGPVRLVVEGADLARLAAGWTLGRVGDQWAWIGSPGESSDSMQR